MIQASQTSDLDEEGYRALAQRVVEANESVVREIRKGREGKVKFLVGCMMREGRQGGDREGGGNGSVQPQEAERVLREVLELPNRGQV